MEARSPPVCCLSAAPGRERVESCACGMGFIPFLGNPHSNPVREHRPGFPAQQFLSLPPNLASLHPHLPIRKLLQATALFQHSLAVPLPAPIPAVRRSSGVSLSARPSRLSSRWHVSPATSLFFKYGLPSFGVLLETAG